MKKRNTQPYFSGGIGAYDIGAYIVIHSKDKGKNPLQVGGQLAHRLRMRSLETASLLSGIRIAQVFKIPQDIKEEVERIVPKWQFYKELKELLQI